MVFGRGKVFEFILRFCPYNKNVVDESKINVFFFKFCHEYVCVSQYTYCSHCTTFCLEVKFWVKDEVIQCKDKCLKCCYYFFGIVFLVYLSYLICIQYKQHKFSLWNIFKFIDWFYLIFLFFFVVLDIFWFWLCYKLLACVEDSILWLLFVFE